VTAADVLQRIGARRWINAGGTLTRYGGALASPDVAAAMALAARRSFDMWELQAAASRAIAAASGAQAGLVTTGASAALTLAAAAAIAGATRGASLFGAATAGTPRPAIVMPRTHRNGYDRAFVTAGAVVVDVGDNDRGTGAGVRGLERADLDAAIDGQTVALAASAAPPCLVDLPVLLEAARDHGLPLIVDAAAQLPPAANLRRFVDAGASLVCFSGGKAIGGPQASGILAGRRELVALAALQMLDLDVLPERFAPPPEFLPDGPPAAGGGGADGWPTRRAVRERMPRQGLGRGFKASKEAVVGLVVALQAFVSTDRAARAQALEARLRTLADTIAAGAATTVRLDWLASDDPERAARLALRCDGPDAAARRRAARRVAERLADGSPPIALAEGGLPSGELVVDLSCVDPDDDAPLAAGLIRALGAV
jgi:L-seryl-tRNA(Ser) seleniumtransferase